jgi:hypothetical protein
MDIAKKGAIFINREVLKQTVETNSIDEMPVDLRGGFVTPRY